ncbi:MAG: PTS galactosamine transporter subunit IIB [Mycoplasmatales bacterium]
MGTPNIVLVRIDNRLIHGQVATAWTNHVSANLLIVPNDDVSTNEMRQSLMDMATPQGVQTRYFSIQKTIDVIHKASPKQIIALIVETPLDVLRLVEGGVPITLVNIGNMHMEPGKKQISKAVCVDDNDIAAFKKIAERGIKLEIQRVPAEGKEDLLKLI